VADRVAGGISEQISELFLGKTGFADYGAERALGKLAMIGHGQTAACRMAQNNVAVRLIVHFVTELWNAFPASAPEQTGKRFIPALRLFPQKSAQEWLRCVLPGYEDIP